MKAIENKALSIGENLRTLRYSKKLSQEDIAALLAISQKTYSNMENGRSKIDIETLKKIADNVFVQNNSFKDSSPMQGIIHNYNSEDLITQLKERIEDLKNSNAQKDALIEILKNRLDLNENPISET